MSALLVRLTLLAALAVPPAVAAQGEAHAGSDDVVELELSGRPGHRREFFELRLGDEVVGTAQTLVGSRAGHVQTELRLQLFAARTRVLHVEEARPGGPRLVWREMRPRSGRTVVVDWGPDGSLSTVDWSGGRAVRRDEEPVAGALLPLFLVGRAREGLFPRGAFDVFDPLAGRVEEWTASVVRVPLSPGGLLSGRRLVLTRVDGTLAGEYLFLDRRLLAFRFQRGGPVAVRVPRGQFEELGQEERERRAREADETVAPSPVSASSGR